MRRLLGHLFGWAALDNLSRVHDEDLISEIAR
jgi:hypothetical protein